MSWTSDLDGLLERAVAERRVPGAVAVVTGPGELVYEGAAGTATPSTVFRIASMTKAVTSVAALQLLEQGRLELDQPVESILPEFGELQVLEGFDGDTPRLRPPATPATIRHLMTHTSGLGYFFVDLDLVRFHEVTGTPSILTGLRASLRTPLTFDPGTRWAYSIAVDWLGLVVEAVSGQDLAAYFTEHIFTPLGMTDTTFAPTDEQRGRLIPVHHRTPDGGLVAGDLEMPAEPEFWAGGSGLYGTGRDYARFMAALLADGGPILRPETVDLMFTDHLRGAPLPEIIRSAAPELINDIPSLPVAQGWGLGLHLTLEDLAGMRRAGTGDWAGLFNCYFWIDRASGIAAAFLTQVLPFFDAAIVEAMLGMEQSVYGGVTASAA
ncbi:MAG TPA: serine hydrolase domain-containing protein [Solirubrobacteraceae bacterium]|jgi:CubicO group peptidase (beta-lactamase class C family)